MKLYMKELNNEENEIMSLLKGIPEEDIDHHETDLYLRKTPEVTAKVINKLPDTYKKNVTTFIDDIDHVTWYEIPFVFPRGKRRKHIEEESKQYSKKKSMFTEDMDISKYRLNKFVDKLVAEAIDKINNGLNCDELVAKTYRKPADNAIVFISSVYDVPGWDNNYPKALRYIDDHLTSDDRKFYIWVKQNKYDNQTYIHSSVGYGNHYAKYFDDLDELTSYVLDELVPRIVDNVNKAYEEYLNKYGNVSESITESTKYTVDNLKKLVRDMIMDRGFNTGMIRWDKSKNTLAISLAEENEDAYQWEVITVPTGKLIDYDDIDSISKYAEAIVDTVIGKYYDLVECVDKTITESLNEWDVEKIASMIEDCLYDRNFMVDRRKIWGKDIDFTVSYKYDDSHDSFTVRGNDFENVPEDEWFDLARAKAEEIAEAVLDSSYNW